VRHNSPRIAQLLDETYFAHRVLDDFAAADRWSHLKSSGGPANSAIPIAIFLD
jgi:hypothetical protein